ncbi:MAG: ATP synthase subunit I [Acidobacteriia bacterium]|nr:ATP synthase subunit I [Terriglobia bacterium]
MRPVPPPTSDDETHARFSMRLQGLTLGLGFAAAIAVLIVKSPRAGCGVAIGTLLAWLNYRWLDRGLDALVRAAKAQAGIPQPRVPSSVYWKFGGRYVLIALLVYASVSFLHVPLLAVVIGLLSLGAGALAEGLYEIISGSS